MAKSDGDFTIRVQVKIRCVHLLKLLLYRLFKGRRTWTIEELIEKDRKRESL